MATFTLKEKNNNPEVLVLVRGIKHFGEFTPAPNLIKEAYKVDETNYPDSLKVKFASGEEYEVISGYKVEPQNSGDSATESKVVETSTEGEESNVFETNTLSSSQKALLAQIQARKEKATKATVNTSSMADEISLRRSGKMRIQQEIEKRRNR